jgi:hypothetical protein
MDSRLEMSTTINQFIDQQLRLKAEAAAAARVAEERAVAAMRAKFEEDARKEQEAQLRRQQAKAAHEQALRTQLGEAERQERAAKEAERSTEAATAAQAALRQRVVAEARRRLLEEHAARLKGYLPPHLEAELKALAARAGPGQIDNNNNSPNKTNDARK